MRRQQLLAAGRRYQTSDIGENAHCRRQRAYREHQHPGGVTHQGPVSIVKPAPHKKREDFRGFLDEVLTDQPQDRELHVMLDNYSPHKRNDDWLAKFEGRVRFHFTPASASWLNQIETPSISLDKLV